MSVTKWSHQRRHFPRCSELHRVKNWVSCTSVSCRDALILYIIVSYMKRRISNIMHRMLLTIKKPNYIPYVIQVTSLVQHIHELQVYPIHELQLHIVILLNCGTSPQNRSSSSLSKFHSSWNGFRAMCMTRSRIPRSPLFSTCWITSSRIQDRGRNYRIILRPCIFSRTRQRL